MAMYGLAVTRDLRHRQPDISQVWYADNATGKLQSLFEWWKQILHQGPCYGYFPKAAKTCVIVKPDLLDSAKDF